MRSGLSFDQIFPIRNDASARLMWLKADCLYDAGIIDAEERFAVYARTGSALGFSRLNVASLSAYAEQPARAAR